MEPPTASRQAFNTTRTAWHGQRVDAFSLSLHAASDSIGALALAMGLLPNSLHGTGLKGRFANPREVVFEPNSPWSFGCCLAVDLGPGTRATPLGRVKEYRRKYDEFDE